MLFRGLRGPFGYGEFVVYDLLSVNGKSDGGVADLPVLIWTSILGRVLATARWDSSVLVNCMITEDILIHALTQGESL